MSPRSSRSRKKRGREEEEEEEVHPLFMTTLPKDFKSNAGLAALAAIENEPDPEPRRSSRKKKKKNEKGGVEGMVEVVPDKEEGELLKPPIATSTASEATLFLKMWSLK